ncbi:polysaccharide biosynthesis tyrosine autokinase [Bifidobacterium longum subsp. longum]|uniref:polysaccharide biosynthesis tyrosine autokinase n=1 Tax=Bifidobacterium longum TaxID=216816 RepID=UPI00019CB1F6|nr:polysaccharide biosynthesis tyrosine autokinase [Bifidobacterium longum]EEI81266.1 chain length determinant protein [Bifidobacterium longum subsp. longum ATCC 55813]QOL27680.1 polysaccharide biosynthesis tyrosine autokinase [Bifidobacterium longum subsp. longum]QOL30274.1 polysaccharide biosynthesis tyrosine autokinase [Bifidobacterium longum subsp. infantis]
MSIADLLQIVRKHLASAIISFVVVFAAVAAVTFIMPPKYTATAEVFATYAGQSGETQTTNDMSSGANYLNTQITTYPELVKTEAVLQPVIKDLGLDMTTTDLAGVVTATNPPNTFMVDISAEVGDPQQAADIANSVAKNLADQISSDLYNNSSSSNGSPIKLTVVQKAQTPTSQSSPNIPLYLAVGLIFGIIVGVGVALLRDILNTKVDSTDDVRELTHASSLGTVPQATILDDSRPVIVAQPAGSEAEEFRRIRTNLSFLTTTATQGHGRLLVISSTNPSEGKTTVSANVAVALAEEGKSVLFIDADLRHPSVAHKLGIEGHVGLSHVLSRQASPADVIQKYWKPNLHIMPAGKRPANASILLNSDLMKEMVERALTQYDYVIIDTAPLSVASEATVFGRMAGGLVLVTGKGVVEKKELENTATALQAAEVPILGFIFNFADPKKIHSKNYYYYYYEDGNKRSSHKGAKSKGKKKARK